MQKDCPLTVSHRQAMEWFENRRHEYNRLISAVYPYVSSDSTIFDIGANIGYFTLLLAERVKLLGSAYLFEPIPHLAELCKATFLNARFRATVFDFGLSDKDTEEDMFIAQNGNLGWNTLVSEKTSPDMRKVRVRLKSFDGCGIDATPSLIKIDVEGYEYMVFRGMLSSIPKWSPLPVMLCEIGWGRSHPAWDEEMSVLREMKAIGYAICDLAGSRIDESCLEATTDVLLIPEIRLPGRS
jgi:FkbM family methyltransferase